MNKEEIKSFKNYVEAQDAQIIIDLMDGLKLKGQLNNERGDNTYRLYNSDNEIILQFVKKYSEKFIEDQDLYVSEYIFALYEENSFMRIHKDAENDKEVISTVLYLNDDYTGGELSFPEIDGGYNYAPEKYEFLYFPTPYLHGVNTVKSGKRYIVTISYSDKIKYKNIMF